MEIRRAAPAQPRRGRRAFLALAAALGALAAPAARGYQGEPLDAYSGILVAPTRAVGVGGAVVGMCDDAASLTVNPAAAAISGRHLESGWGIGGFITWFLPTSENIGTIRYPGSGGTSEAILGGAGEVLVGGTLQPGGWGIGADLKGWSVRYDVASGERYTLGTLDLMIAGGALFLEDQLAVGAAAVLGVGRVLYESPGAPDAQIGYRSFGARVGARWAPRGERYRLGAAFAPPTYLRPADDRGSFPIVAPESIVEPWELSVGASAWFGPNAHLYNAPSPARLAVHPDVRGELPPVERGRPSPLLVAVQLDLVGAEPRAVTLDGVTQPQPAPSGRHVALVPRLGLEWEAWRRWVNLRAGSYLQPARAGQHERLHGTFGVEARIPFWPIDLSIGFGGDAAQGFRNVGVSLGFWGDVGPLPR